MAVGTESTWNPVQPPAHMLKRFTVEEYHRMIDSGVFVEDDRFELLEGWIVSKMTRKPPHDVTIGIVQEQLHGLIPAGWHARIQMAITTAESEPEPDLAIARGVLRDYLPQHPSAADIALVIEVADTTLAKDRDFKGRLYARAGVPIYWLVNLVAFRIEVYTNPTGPDPHPHYRDRHDVEPGETLALVLDGREIARIDARDLLP